MHVHLTLEWEVGDIKMHHSAGSRTCKKGNSKNTV